MTAGQNDPTRRRILAGLGMLGAGTVIGCSSNQKSETEINHHGFSHMSPKTADEAIVRLVAGNKCYISEHFDIGNARRTGTRREEVASAPHPYAVILSCADSRVAPEIVFTAGLGDLFVVRVAGNIVSSHCLGVAGSIEYAIAELKIPLILVLGHENCGAVKAAMEYFQTGTKPVGAISVITDAIRPAIERVANQPGNLLNNAVAANVNQSVENLRGSADIVVPAVAAGDVTIVGGVYELASGQVRLLE